MRQFIALRNGVPSHDRLATLIRRRLVEGSKRIVQAWTQAVMQSTGGEGIPIDGKRVRGLRDGRGGIEPLHRVSAGASRNRLVLGRDAVEDFFTTALGAGSVGVKVEAIEAVDKGEGRLERRRWAVLRCGAGHDCPLVPPASSARERRWAAIAALLLPLTAVSPWALLVLAPPFSLDTASGASPAAVGAGRQP